MDFSSITDYVGIANVMASRTEGIMNFMVYRTSWSPELFDLQLSLGLISQPEFLVSQTDWYQDLMFHEL